MSAENINDLPDFEGNGLPHPLTEQLGTTGRVHGFTGKDGRKYWVHANEERPIPGMEESGGPTEKTRYVATYAAHTNWDSNTRPYFPRVSGPEEPRQGVLFGLDPHHTVERAGGLTMWKSDPSVVGNDHTYHVATIETEAGHTRNGIGVNSLLVGYQFNKHLGSDLVADANRSDAGRSLATHIATQHPNLARNEYGKAIIDEDPSEVHRVEDFGSTQGSAVDKSARDHAAQREAAREKVKIAKQQSQGGPNYEQGDLFSGFASDQPSGHIDMTDPSKRGRRAPAVRRRQGAVRRRQR